MGQVVREGIHGSVGRDRPRYYAVPPHGSRKGDGVYELAQVNQYGDDLFHVAHGFVYPSDIDADEQARLISEFGWLQGDD